MQQMAAQIVNAVKVPVTAKTRLGWTNDDKPIVEAALRLQDAGVAALTIHGRTREQLYSGKADWTLIGEVKNHQEVKIPIIGNGDIYSAEVAQQRLKETGVDALMIGRGAIGRPWLFREIKHFLETGEKLPFPTVAEIAEVLREQMKMNLEWKDDERAGILMLRRHFAKYFPGLPNFRELRIRLLRAETSDEINEILNTIVDIYGSASVDHTISDLK